MCNFPNYNATQNAKIRFGRGSLASFSRKIRGYPPNFLRTPREVIQRLLLVPDIRHEQCSTKTTSEGLRHRKKQKRHRAI